MAGDPSKINPPMQQPTPTQQTAAVIVGAIGVGTLAYMYIALR